MFMVSVFYHRYISVGIYHNPVDSKSIVLNNLQRLSNLLVLNADFCCLTLEEYIGNNYEAISHITLLLLPYIASCDC